MLNLNDCFNRLFLKGFFEKIHPPSDSVLLDLGCGVCPFSDLYSSKFDTVFTSDIEVRSENVDVLSSVEKLPFANGSFNAVLFSEVIEHIADDRLALREIHRVLATDGYLLLTWPSMYKMHELPTDYWRHTEFGMARRLSAAGFEVSDLKRRGDFISVATNIFGEGISLGIKLLTRVPILGLVFIPIQWLVNLILSATFWSLAKLQYRSRHLNPEMVGDRLTGFGGRLALFTLGYCLIARKTDL
jgi:SAM-dependent methyltransferase